MKIGILSPRSKVYPAIGRDFMDGLKIYLEKQGLSGQAEFITESVGFGGSEKEVYEKAENLLILEQVDILVAYIDEKVLDLLKPLVYSSRKLMLVVNPGANYMINWVPQPNIVHLTLQHSFCCWLTGALAADEPGSTAGTSSTFYDCGYLHAAAMVKSFVKRGGEIKFNYINNQAYNDAFHINELTDFLSKQPGTKKLLCQFDSLPASLFYKLLTAYEGADGLRLFVSPMMMNKKALEGQNDGFNFSIEGYVPWDPSLQNKANIEFVDLINEAVKKEANIFLLLGWETGLILEQILLNNPGNYEDGAYLAESIKKIKLNSPRGELKLDGDTQFYLSTPYKCLVKPHSTKPGIECMENYEQEWKLFTGEPTEGAIAGWTNTYLCY